MRWMAVMGRARPGGEWGVRVPGPGDALEWARATSPVRPVVVVRATPGAVGAAPVVPATRVAVLHAFPMPTAGASRSQTTRAPSGRVGGSPRDGWVLPVLGTRDARSDEGELGLGRWRHRGLTDGSRAGGGLVRRMLAARVRGTWTGTGAAWERLRRLAATAGETADGRGRWAVRGIAEVRRVLGRGRLLEARVQWRGAGPDGGVWPDTWVRVVHPWLSADLRRTAREMERATYGRGRAGKRERPEWTGAGEPVRRSARLS